MYMRLRACDSCVCVRNKNVTHRSANIWICRNLFCLSRILKRAAPVAEWVRSLNFSALNHSIITSL